MTKAIRKIMQAPHDSITIELPPDFRLRNLEVLVTPIAEQVGVDSVWPQDFFTRIAGGWSGAPLERGPQGEFEARLALD